MEEAPMNLSDKDEVFGCISPWAKWGLYFIAWGAVVLVALANNPSDLLSAPGFPIGFIAMFPNGAEKAITAAWLLGPISIGIGWTLYAVLSIVMSCAKRISVFLPVYIVFCILLTLNVIGCRKILETMAGIH
jgi:hypothetical protein